MIYVKTHVVARCKARRRAQRAGAPSVPVLSSLSTT